MLPHYIIWSLNYPARHKWSSRRIGIMGRLKAPLCTITPLPMDCGNSYELLWDATFRCFHTEIPYDCRFGFKLELKKVCWPSTSVFWLTSYHTLHCIPCRLGELHFSPCKKNVLNSLIMGPTHANGWDNARRAEITRHTVRRSVSGFSH